MTFTDKQAEQLNNTKRATKRAVLGINPVVLPQNEEVQELIREWWTTAKWQWSYHAGQYEGSGISNVENSRRSRVGRPKKRWQGSTNNKLLTLWWMQRALDQDEKVWQRLRETYGGKARATWPIFCSTLNLITLVIKGWSASLRISSFDKGIRFPALQSQHKCRIKYTLTRQASAFEGRGNLWLLDSDFHSAFLPRVVSFL